MSKAVLLHQAAANYVKVTVSLEQYMTEGFEPLGDNFVWTAEGYFGAGTQATRSVSRGSYRARIDAECWENGVLAGVAHFLQRHCERGVRELQRI